MSVNLMFPSVAPYVAMAGIAGVLQLGIGNVAHVNI